MANMFMNTLPEPYLERLVGCNASNFADVVSTGELPKDIQDPEWRWILIRGEEAVHSGTEEERRGCKCHIFLSEQG